MKKVKIFLASSKELNQERLELSDFVEHLNLILEKFDINIQLVKWEYLDSSMGSQHKQEDYNDKLRECEICLVLYWKSFGLYTKSELDTAFSELKSGNNPKKLYVYFKDIEGEEEISKDLKEFRDSFPKEYGHFENRFRNIDTLKSQFLLQFMEYKSNELKGSPLIEVRDGQIFMGGRTYVNLMNVPFVGNNKEYTDLLSDIEDLNEWIEENEPDHKKYADKAAKLREKIEKKEKMEISLWATALEITRLSNQKCSERLQRAIDLFHKGDNKGAIAILNEEEIYKDAQQNINLIKLGEEGRKGLITNIEELKLKNKTLENEMSEGFVEKILNNYQEIKNYAENAYGIFSCEYINTMVSLGREYWRFDRNKEAYDVMKIAVEIAPQIYNLDLDFISKLNYYFGISLDKMGNTKDGILFINKSLESLKNQGNLKVNEILQCYETLASITQDIDSKIKYLFLSEELILKNFGSYSEKLYFIYSRLSNYFLSKGYLDEALKYALKELEIASLQWEDNHLFIGLINESIAIIFKELNDGNNAAKHYEKAIQIYENNKNFHRLENLYYKMLLNFEEKKEYRKAIEYLKRILNK